MHCWGRFDPLLAIGRGGLSDVDHLLSTGPSLKLPRQLNYGLERESRLVLLIWANSFALIVQDFFSWLNRLVTCLLRLLIARKTATAYASKLELDSTTASLGSFGATSHYGGPGRKVIAPSC